MNISTISILVVFVLLLMLQSLRIITTIIYLARFSSCFFCFSYLRNVKRVGKISKGFSLHVTCQAARRVFLCFCAPSSLFLFFFLSGTWCRNLTHLWRQTILPIGFLSPQLANQDKDYFIKQRKPKALMLSCLLFCCSDTWLWKHENVSGAQPPSGQQPFASIMFVCFLSLLFLW